MIRNRIEKARSHLSNHSQHQNHNHKTIRLIPAMLTRPAKARAAKMQPQQSLAPQPKDVWKVSAWKWGIDKGAPRWRHLFFTWVFLPFLGLSFRLGIPAPKEVVVEADEQGKTRRIYRWFEDEGIFEHEDQAEAGCLGEHWGYTMLPYGRLMPPDSGQYGGTIFPRKQQGDRRRARVRFPFVIKDRRQEELNQKTLSDYLARLHQVLDQ